MSEDRYLECSGCGQVVQGWEASNAIACCKIQDYAEVSGPEQDGAIRFPEGERVEITPNLLLARFETEALLFERHSPSSPVYIERGEVEAVIAALEQFSKEAG